tara:strand:+ start:8190 stop:8936 length:747 start_codon:yes stop_codon:yes gene_type:complete
MKLIIYTALFADENIPLEEVGEFYPFNHNKDDVEYVAFTNRDDLESNFWDVHYIPIEEGLSPRMMSRKIKWNPSLYLENCTHTIWMDSQCYFKFEPKAIVDYILQSEYHTAIHHHTDLQSTYTEGMLQCYYYSLDKPSIINPQMEKYFKEGLPYKYDHYETGILIRKNCDESKQLSENVWGELQNHSIRDQLSTPYCVFKARQKGDQGIKTISESFTAHKGGLPLPKSQLFFTVPKPSRELKENLDNR